MTCRPRRGGCRADRPAASDRLDVARPLLLEDALHAADGVALAVQQAADALEQVDIIRAVIAPPAAALHRLDLGEPRLPEPQHVLGNVEFFSDFADGAERIRRLVQMLAPLDSSGL